MKASDEPRTRAFHDLANRLLAVGARLEAIAATGHPETAKLAGEALADLAAARAVLDLLSGSGSTATTPTDLGFVVRQAATAQGARLRRGEAGGDAKIALGAAAVQAVLESVLRCERSNAPTVFAVAVGDRARVTVESSASPFSPTDRERLLDPTRLRNPEELGAGLAFAACAEIVRRAGGEFTLGGEERRCYSIELPLARAGKRARESNPRVDPEVDGEKPRPPSD